jgi:hypothetical protein
LRCFTAKIFPLTLIFHAVNDLVQMTEVLMQRLFLGLLVVALSGMAAHKLDPDFCRSALAALTLIEKVEQLSRQRSTPKDQDQPNSVKRSRKG